MDVRVVKIEMSVDGNNNKYNQRWIDENDVAGKDV